jgi:5'-nucleotidase
MSGYIRTYSGRKFHTDPRPDDVDLTDIAVALSRIPRFGGHSEKIYPVAAHCIHVARMVPKHLRLQALFHDASEAYLMDIPSPLKAALPDYKRLERRVMLAVASHFNFAWPKHPLVRQADSAALYLERKALFSVPFDYDTECFPAIPPPIEVGWDFDAWCALTPKATARAFIHFTSFLLE